jgi:fructose-1,6-bisphosphatase I
MMQVPQTLQLYLLKELKDHPERIDLVMMMADIATIGKLISARTNRTGLTDFRGLTNDTNVQGETQAKLDVYTNELCKNYLRSTGLFAALASEEEDAAVDVNVSVGTIFSVHKKLDGLAPGDAKQFLQPGKDQVLAGYVLYGSSTVLVFSWGNGVHEFTLDVDLGEFLLSNEHVSLPAECPYYSFNEAYAPFIAERDQKYLVEVRQKADKLRWIASLVADFHRNLIKGGIFFMPAFDVSGQGNFKPKLRLNYEAKPIAFLMQQAGGTALAGDENILDIVPSELHQRVAVNMGNTEVVERYKEVS